MKIKRILVVLSSVLLVACLLGSIGIGCAPAGPKVIKIAEIVAQSGPAAGWGILNAACDDMAVEDVNAAGGIVIDGDTYTLELIRYDHQYDPGITATLARKAIFDDGVKAILCWDRPMIDAFYEFAAEEKVTIIGMTSTGELGANYPWLFNSFYTRADNMEVLMEYAGQAHPGARIAGAYYDDEEAYETNMFREQFAAQEGLVDAGVTYYSTDITDFYPVLAGILDSDPDIIDPSGIVAEHLGLLAKQARENGYEGIFVYAGTPGLPEATEIAGWDAFEGYLGAGEFIEFPTEWGRDFFARYQARTDGNTDTWPGYWYDAIWLLKHAFEEADSLDMEKVNEAMGRVSYEGIKGISSYSDVNGLPRRMVEKVPIVEVRGGQLIEVFFDFPKSVR